MKKQNIDVCPGCSRHCTRNEIRCKRGRAYFAEHSEAESKEIPMRRDSHKKHKWEKHVCIGGLFWQLIFVSRKVKKALRREKIAEEQLMSVLDDQDRLQLSRILKKLDERIK